MIVPGSVNPFFLANGGDPLDELGRIERSLRIRLSSSAYLSKTFGQASDNPLKWTANVWVKKTGFSGIASLLGSNTGTAAVNYWAFTGDALVLRLRTSSLTGVGNLVSNSQYRDTSAWMNCHIVYDTANAVATDRVKFYVDGVRVSSTFSESFALSQAPTGNFDTVKFIGRLYDGNGPSNYYSDFLIANYAYVDNQALTPDYFGVSHPVTGQWRPKAKGLIKSVVDSGGINSFFLTFEDATNLTTLTTDYSIRGNNWTANNISLTAGATYDSLLDTPTRSFATLNPINPSSNSNVTYYNGNLRQSCALTSNDVSQSNFDMTYGKWYWEAVFTTAATQSVVGIQAAENSSNYCEWLKNGTTTNLGGATLSSWAVNDVLGIALDVDNKTIQFFKNGSSAGSAISIPNANSWLARIGNDAHDCSINFGQQPFSYSPPVGYLSLNAKNLQYPVLSSPGLHFDAATYLGTGAVQNINSFKFKPDFVWLRDRTTVTNYALFDNVRGVLKSLSSNLSSVETSDTDSLTSFNPTGITLGANTSGPSVNINGKSYVDWSWRAGSVAATNNVGTISSQVSANPASGFSVVTYTGTGAVGTVGHGLNAAPKMMIFKPRVSSTTDDNWNVGHSDLAGGFTAYLILNSTQGQITATNRFNNTAPTSSVFTAGLTLSDSGKGFVAYCFAEVPGFSKFGSYTGNGSADGPFINCGLRPRWILTKRADSTGEWWIFDTVRQSYNSSTNPLLRPNDSTIEATVPFDILSNGFKTRTTNVNSNANGGTYIYAAFAEFPFRYANAR